MNFTKHIFLFLIGCAGIMPALAQQTYTLNECIREALSNNVRIKNANNDLSASQHVRQKALPNTFLRLALREADLCQTRDYLKWK